MLRAALPNRNLSDILAVRKGFDATYPTKFTVRGLGGGVIKPLTAGGLRAHRGSKP
jgi:hypothetical protein